MSADSSNYPASFEVISCVVSYFNSYEEDCEWVLSSRPEGSVVVDMIPTYERDEHLDHDEYIVKVVVAPSREANLSYWAEKHGCRFIPAEAA